MRVRVNYDNDADHPELVALCESCTRDDCEGLCDDWRNAWRRIHGQPQLARTTRKRAGKHLYNGEWLTLTEIARRNGMSRVCLYGRLKRGLTMEEATKTPTSGRGRYRYITWRGETRPIGAWAKLLGINHSTLYRRIDRGMPLDEAMNPIVKTGRKPRLYTARGKTQTLAEWAKETGYTINSIRSFTDHGMSMEDIIKRGERRGLLRKTKR